jgi:Fe-S cluster biogenesis protein NfuA
MTHQELIEAINQVLTAVRPMIQMHNGDIEFVKFDAGVVYVRMHGACVGCPISSYTIKLGVEQALKEKIPGVLEVIALEE